MLTFNNFFLNAHMVSFCSPACSWNKSSWTTFPLNSFDFWDKNEWMRPEYIQTDFAKLKWALISNQLMALWAKYTGYNITFILVDTLKWLSHFKNDLKNCLRDLFWKYISFILLHKWKITFLKKGMIKKTWKLRNTWKTKNSHDSSILGDSTVQWHQEAVLGSGEQRPRGPPYVQVPKCDIQCFTMEKSHSSYKSIFIKFSQMLNSI